MTQAEKLTKIRDNYTDQLVALSDPSKRKVSYSIGNRSVSWTEYQSQLRQWIKEVEKDLADLAAADGTASVVSAIP